jgi:hypothetical protein
MINKFAKGYFIIFIFVFIVSCFAETGALLDNFIDVKNNGTIDEKERISQK